MNSKSNSHVFYTWNKSNVSFSIVIFPTSMPPFQFPTWCLNQVCSYICLQHLLSCPFKHLISTYMLLVVSNLSMVVTYNLQHVIKKIISNFKGLFRKLVTKCIGCVKYSYGGMWVALLHGIPFLLGLCKLVQRQPFISNLWSSLFLIFAYNLVFQWPFISLTWIHIIMKK